MRLFHNTHTHIHTPLFVRLAVFTDEAWLGPNRAGRCVFREPKSLGWASSLDWHSPRHLSLTGIYLPRYQILCMDNKGTRGVHRVRRECPKPDVFGHRRRRTEPLSNGFGSALSIQYASLHTVFLPATGRKLAM